MRDNRVSEELLHFVWQHRYYNTTGLTTEAGMPLFVDYPGDHNKHQGPDFLHARLHIADSPLNGPVELHLKTSDWYRHRHDDDPHYQNTILHVVWENDSSRPPAGIPILTLHDRVAKSLLDKYNRLLEGRPFVACAPLLPAAIPWAPFKTILIHQRLQSRTAFIRTLLEEHRPHWDQTLFWLIARALGQPVNTQAFLTIARSLPFVLLLRRRTDTAHIETLLLDQAARLTQPLSFFLMRPAHSPHTRLRQLAALLTNHTGRFATLLESDHPSVLLKTLHAEGLGTATKHSILINAFIPLLYAYGTLRQEPALRTKALRWLELTPPENNHIIRGWRQLGLPAATAADTQALLELKRNYCDQKKCLQCAIGQHLLSAAPIATPAPPAPPTTPPGQ